MRDFPVLRGNGSSLWDLALSAHREQVSEGQDNSKSVESTVIFVGNKQSGKTTLFHNFQDSNDTVRPTMALEYRYIRKSGRAGAKDICHMWELAGSTIFERLLFSPLGNLHNTSIVMMLDLSMPERLWFTMENLLMHLRAHIDKIVDNTKNLKEKLMKEAWKRIGEDHADKEHLDPFPIPLAIIGSKYDLFKEFDPEQKKLICRTLRWIAHTHGATLLFYSSKDAGLIKKAKQLLHQYCFNVGYSKMIAQDYNQPLLIPAGADSLQQIGGPGGETQDASTNTMNVWKLAFTSRYPQPEKEQNDIPDDPSRDSTFAEPEIDTLRTQKLEELELYRRENDLIDRMQYL